jgi:hypothetical protein
MVEVFKTNVKDQDHAKMLVDQIHAMFAGYMANFDLEDCDKILRVVSPDGFIHTSRLMKLLNNYGFRAEVLPDDIPEVFHF